MGDCIITNGLFTLLKLQKNHLQNLIIHPYPIQKAIKCWILEIIPLYSGFHPSTWASLYSWLKFERKKWILRCKASVVLTWNNPILFPQDTDLFLWDSSLVHSRYYHVPSRYCLVPSRFFIQQDNILFPQGRFIPFPSR